MKQMFSYLKGYKKECILAPLFKMLEACFELIVPLVVAAMIDHGIGNQDRGYAVRMCLVLVGLGLVGLAASLTAQYFAAKAATGFAKELRHSLFSHLMGLSFTEIDRMGTSTMITRMTSDVNQAQTGVNMFLRLFLRSPFVVLGAMLMAFTIDVQAALVFVVIIGILSVAVFFIMRISIPRLKNVQGRLDEVLLRIRENLLGVRVLRAFCKKEEENRRFEEKNGLLYQGQRKAGFVSALMNPLTMVLINAAIAQLIYVGAVRVDVGLLTQGQVVALYNYMTQILVELIKFANLIVTINKSLASARRLADAFEVKNSMEDAMKLPEGEEKKDAPVVEFREVSFRYHEAGKEALSDISFTAEKGETIGIIGGTGSGKSTLVNLIPRFYDATSGSVLVNGKDVRACRQKTLRERIGVVLQKAVLFQGTIGENLRWGNENATDEEIQEAVKAAQAQDVVEKKGGLSGNVSQEGRNLSGGQRQRLSIARALVRWPDILILDDSSSALDYATDKKLRKAVAALSWNPVTFIVSQRTSSIQHADKILVLEDGKMAGCGTHGELLESCEVYREIYQTCTNQGKEA